jgi:hypothetical protein
VLGEASAAHDLAVPRGEVARLGGQRRGAHRECAPYVDVNRRWRSWLRRSGPKRRERLRRDVHERRSRGDRRNRQKPIHARPQQHHAPRIAARQRRRCAGSRSNPA